MSAPMRLLVLCALALVACRQTPARPPVRVAAASDLTVAFEAMRAGFERQSGEKVEFVFGSSGQLSKQLVEGAPYDLFAAANEAFTDKPIASGACLAGSRAQYAEGHLVVFAPKEPITALEELRQPRFVRIAIANPELAPYGKAAKEALVAAGLWDDVEPRLVYGQNIQQTFQLARSGNVEAALVSRSLAKEGLAVAPSLYAPLKQALVVCSRGKNAEGAQAFRAFVLGEEGRAVLSSAGFGLPVPQPGH
jgi:molybdate transport system substrate-binding protein